MTMVGRRQMLLGAGALGWAATASSANQPSRPAADPPPALLTTPPEAIVATGSGRIRGFRRNGIYIFRGVRYGANPAAEGRFLPPRAAEPWSEVRSCLSYGPVCPQPERNWSLDEMAFIADWNDGHPSEDCLTLNVWSKDLSPNSRRPVIVWLHGGGFVTGSSHELPSYEGSRLAARDAVVVSVNHRLGALGFLDLSAYDERLVDSGNAGMLDIVLALRWVRDNISEFGGDAGRVTIAGQSGGGGKVSALMAMSDAQGLFHRAVVMSGSFSPTQPQHDSRAVADALFSEARLRPGDIGGLRTLPAVTLVSAGAAAIRRVHGPQGLPAVKHGRLGAIKGWGPVADGRVLPLNAWTKAAPSESRHVPMLIGNVRDEFKLSTMFFDEEKLRELAQSSYGEKSDALLVALREDFPTLTANERAGIVTGVGFHNSAIDQCLLKAQQHAAPVYQYWFVYSPDLLDGRIGVPHCAEIAYFFDNAAACDQQTGNSPLANQIAAEMSAALVRFASSGDPGAASLRWSPFTETEKEAMVFGRDAQLQRYPGSRVFELTRAT